MIPRYQHSAGKSNDRIRHVRGLPRGSQESQKIDQENGTLTYQVAKLVSLCKCIAKLVPLSTVTSFLWIQVYARISEHVLPAQYPCACTNRLKDHRQLPPRNHTSAMAFHLHAAAFIAARLHRRCRCRCCRLLKLTIEVIAQQSSISTDFSFKKNRKG